MSDIDELFKKGLDGKGLEYSDASWVAMEQLLDGKKVGFFARFKGLLSVVALLLISSAVLFYLSSQSPNLKSANTLTAVDENIEIETHRNNSSLVTMNTTSNTAAEQADNLLAPNAVDAERIAAENENVRMPAMALQRATFSRTTKKTRTYQMAKGILSEGELKGEKQETTVPTMSKGLDKSNWQVASNLKPFLLSGFPYDITASETRSSVDYPSSPVRKFYIYASPYVGFLNYTKSTKLPIDVTDELDNFNKSKTRSSINYGLDVTVKRKQWSLTTGVGFMSLKEQSNFRINTEHTDYITAKRILEGKYQETPRGTKLVLIGDVIVDSTATQQVNVLCENCDVKLDYLSIPLSLQYDFGKRRLRYFAEAGIIASFLQNAKGNYAFLYDKPNDSTTVKSVDIVDLASSNQVTKMLLQANAAVGVKYWIAPRWNMWSSYGYSFGLNSMLGNYEQKVNLKSLRVGVEFKLR